MGMVREKRTGCLGCAARDNEIEFLRSEVTRMQDRLLATLNPSGYAIYRGTSNEVIQGAAALQPGVGQEQTVVDQGEVKMLIGGKLVGAAEYQQAMEKLEEAMSGRTPGVNGGDLPV